jgi:chemotaxis protein CheD
MELLINAMIRLGARRQNLRAKVFGGSSVLHSEQADSFFAVGETNSRFIVEFLKTDGIPLISKDLGGSVGRVIYFSSEDFAVYVRKIGAARQDKIVLEEKTFWAKSIERQETTDKEPEIWL